MVSWLFFVNTCCMLILCIEINIMFMISLLACVIVAVLIMDGIMLYVHTMYLNCCMLLMCMHEHCLWFIPIVRN